MDASTPDRGEPTAVAEQDSAPPRERMEAVLYELRRVVVGQDRLLDRVLVSLLSRGHVLLEGVPGLAKTLTLETAARVCGGRFSRIQFTPDLVPSDVVGGQVLDRHGDFATRLGPVFANFVLADEINRAPAKTQSALLEVMAEGHVSIGGNDPQRAAAVPRARDPESDRERGRLPASRGPDDRFPMKLVVGYPTGLERRRSCAAWPRPPRPRQLLDPAQIIGSRGPPTPCTSITGCASTPCAWSPRRASRPTRAWATSTPTSTSAARRAHRWRSIRGGRALAVIRGPQLRMPEDVTAFPRRAAPPRGAVV